MTTIVDGKCNKQHKNQVLNNLNHHETWCPEKGNFYCYCFPNNLELLIAKRLLLQIIESAEKKRCRSVLYNEKDSQYIFTSGSDQQKCLQIKFREDTFQASVHHLDPDCEPDSNNFKIFSNLPTANLSELLDYMAE
jgi:hypothetical protein